MAIAKCMGVDVQDTLAFSLVIGGFVATIPDIVSPAFAAEIPGLPGSVIKLFLGNIKGLPAFSADIPGLGTISLDGPDLNAGLDVPIFDPEGLISLIAGLGKILVGLPELFIDIGPPPIPKFPLLPDAIIELVGVSLSLPSAPILTVDFKSKLIQCIVQEIIGVLPKP